MTARDVTAERTSPPPADDRSPPVWRHPLTALGVVAVAYTVTLLLVWPTNSPLTWDETVYASQFARDVPAAVYSPHRSIGTALLVAPLTGLTGSLSALRVYLAVLSGLGLFCAYWPWLRIRRSHGVPLAAALFASLWLSVYYGDRAMPNLYIALCLVGAVGLFLRATAYRSRRPRAVRWSLCGLTAVFAILTLLRQLDATLAAGVMVTAGLLLAWATRRRRPRGVSLPAVAAAVAAIGTGLAVGWGQWLVEAYARFGGPAARLAATADMNGAGLHVSFVRQLRALSGSVDCKPGQNCGRVTVLGTAWWSAAAGLVIVAFAVAAYRRRMRVAWSLVVATASAVAVPYLLFTSYTAPRYLLPVYALLSLPAAAGLVAIGGGVLTWARRRAVPVMALSCLLPLALSAAVAVDVAGQLGVLRDMARRAYAGPITDRTIAARLTELGVRPPCLISGARAATVAYQLKCQNWDLAYRMYSAPELTQRLADAASTGRTVVALSIGRPTQATPSAWTLRALWPDHTWYALIHPPARSDRRVSPL
jgi:hypothetical protein